MALVNAMGTLLVFVKVTDWPAVGVPIAGDVNVSEVAETVRPDCKVSLAAKASEAPLRVVWNAPVVVGKLEDAV